MVNLLRPDSITISRIRLRKQTNAEYLGLVETPEPQAEPTGRVAVDLADLRSRSGQVLGHSSWRRITQDEVDAFARLTGDHQWIHVDPGRAVAGPFGRTIVHGYFTLSLATVILDEVLVVHGAGLVVNYGANRVRFPAPVPVGSRVRGAVELASAEEIEGGVQLVFRVTVEVEDAPKPGCVADIVYRYYSTFPAGPPLP
jgi:acyl dehydratase